MRTTTLLLAIFCCLSISAQDYSYISTTSVNYYQFDSTSHNYFYAPQHIIAAEKIDSFSLAANGDSVLYPFKRINTYFINPRSCQESFIDSWMGKEIVKKQDSSLFYNNQNEIIYLKTPEQVNQSWNLFYSANSEYVEATVNRFDTLTISNTLDSVVYISLQLKDNTGNPINSSLNSEELIVSKSNGFVRCFNWLEFNTQNAPVVFNFTEYKPLTRGEVFDFNVGDEFHYDKTNSGTPPSAINKFVLDKTVLSNDSIEYIIETRNADSYVDYTTNPPTLVTTVSSRTDTIIYSQLNQIVNPLVPTENYFSGGLSEQLEIRKEMHNGRSTEIAYQGNYHLSADSICPSNDVFYRHYVKGCGFSLSYYDATSGNPGFSYQTRLSYFKKGSETWGTPNVITGSKEITSFNSEILVYPNPTTSTLWLTTSELKIQSIEIYNIRGEKVAEKQVLSNTIDVNFLESGIYFIHFIGSEKTFQQKFIKQ